VAGQHRHIVVVGGGIIGSCAAYHLLQTGARVTIIEAAQCGLATSGAGAGFVSHWSAGMIPMGSQGYHLQQYGIDFYKSLGRHGQKRGEDIGLRAGGTLMLSLTIEGFETHLRPVLESPHAPKEMQYLHPRDIAAKAGMLVDPAKIYAGAYNPLGIQFDTSLGLKLLVDEIADMGGDYREKTRLLEIADRAQGVIITTDKGKIEADGAVLAAGAWNGALVRALGWHLPMLRVLATRVTTDGRGLPSPLPTIQCRELRLWLRETFGAIMWGTGGHYHPLHRLDEKESAQCPATETASRIEPGQPHIQRLMQKMVDEDLAQLQQLFPPLRGSSVAAWAQGIVCYTPDRNPYVGFVPGTNHIVLAGGDNETGVTHGPGLGRLVCELLSGQETMVDIARFRLDRFAQEQFPTEADVEDALPSWSGQGSGKEERAFAGT